MKKKTKATILASIAYVLLVGVALLRKPQCSRLHKAFYVNHVAKIEHYINSILHGNERHCVSQIRMKSIAFHQLCDILTLGEHIRLIVNMSVREQVLIFLHIIGHNVRFHVIGSWFYRSTETVNRYFRVVFRGILKLYRALIWLPSKDTPRKVRDRRRFYPYFKENIGTFVYFLNHYICQKLGLCWSNRWHTCLCICPTWNTRKVLWSQRWNHSKCVIYH